MIDYDVDGDGVAKITWNVSNRPMNVMNNDTMAAYGEAVEKAVADEAVKGVIVTSAHKEFLVGADLSVMGDGDLSMLRNSWNGYTANSGEWKLVGNPLSPQLTAMPWVAGTSFAWPLITASLLIIQKLRLDCLRPRSAYYLAVAARSGYLA